MIIQICQHFSGDKFPILYNVSDTLWTKSTIEVLHDQKNEKICRR